MKRSTLQNTGIILLATSLISNVFSYGLSLWQGIEKAASTKGPSSDLSDQIGKAFSENSIAMIGTSAFALFSVVAYTMLSKIVEKREENDRLFDIQQRENSKDQFEESGIGFLNTPRGLNAMKKIVDNARQNRPN